MASLIVQIGGIRLSLLIGTMQVEQVKSSERHRRRRTPDIALAIYKTIKKKRLYSHTLEFNHRNIHPASVCIGGFVLFFTSVLEVTTLASLYTLNGGNGTICLLQQG